MRGRILGWLIGVCSLLVSAVGRAEEPLAAFQLVYTAYAGCPGEADFLALVMARTQHARLARPGEDRRTFVVSLQPEGTGTRGALTLDGPGGTTETREIVAESCGQAARAMSLIVALALDPTSPDQRPDAPAPTPPNASDQPSVRPPKPPSSDRADKALAKAAPLATAITGLSAEWRGGVVPTPGLIVTSLYAAFGLDPRWTSAVVTAGAGQHRASRELGEARFTYLAGRAELCTWLLRSPFRAGPCVGFSAGVVLARGAPGNHPGALAVTEHRTEPWLEPAGLVRLSWEPVAWVALDALSGVGTPLYHSVYYFGRGTGEPLTVHRVPAVAAFAGLGAGLVFR